MAPRIQYQRQVAGVNIGNKGITSYSKQIKLGKLLNINLNLSSRGITASLSVPGTGLSTDSIPLVSFKK